MIRILNSKRAKGLPEIPVPLPGLKKADASSSGGSAAGAKHAAKYRACADALKTMEGGGLLPAGSSSGNVSLACAQAIAWHYRQDVALMGLQEQVANLLG